MHTHTRDRTLSHQEVTCRDDPRNPKGAWNTCSSGRSRRWRRSGFTAWTRAGWHMLRVYFYIRYHHFNTPRAVLRACAPRSDRTSLARLNGFFFSLMLHCGQAGRDYHHSTRSHPPNSPLFQSPAKSAHLYHMLRWLCFFSPFFW